MAASQFSLLIVDDNELNRDMLARRLGNEGYLVATAENGHVALDRMGVEHFDLVLLDLMMPGLDGYQVLGRMAPPNRLHEIPVIVLTASNDRSSVAKCIELGATDYVIKPFEMAVVKSRIWRCLESRRLQKQNEGAQVVETDTAGSSVLVAEDNDQHRDILERRINQQWGYPADYVRNGIEAVERISAGGSNYDLIMLDINMPGKDGLMVLDFVRSCDYLASVPVIMLSAVDDGDTVSKAMAMGAEDFITKPFNAVELRARMQSCLRLKILRDQEEKRQRSLEELERVGERIRSS